MRIRHLLASSLFGALVQSPALAAGVAAAADCDGMQRLNVITPKGFCLGVLAGGFKFPRGIQPLPNGDVLVADMGNWEPNMGTVWLLKREGSTYQRLPLLTKLDRPNSIAVGPDGLIYVGVVHRIFRFDVKHPETVTDVIGGKSGIEQLPGKGRHLLTAMKFDLKGDLFVNVGSSTDHCENDDGKAPAPGLPCAESEGKEALGAIRKYTMQWPAGTVTNWETYAHGLRNSMALAIHPVSGALWQGENSRDAINAAMPDLKNDNELPHDELNLVQRGAHYGWPYCYDHNLPSPEFGAANCASYIKPVRLLPAHAAPLGMTFYTASRFPPIYRNSLIIGYHGYRQHGHRLVALLPDKAGAPLGKSIDLISGWQRKPGQAMGAPVDIKLGPDGDIYIAEDRNGRLLRLHFAP